MGNWGWADGVSIGQIGFGWAGIFEGERGETRVGLVRFGQSGWFGSEFGWGFLVAGFGCGGGLEDRWW